MKTLSQMYDGYLLDKDGRIYNAETFDDDWERWLYTEAGNPALPKISSTYSELQRIRDVKDMLAAPKWMGKPSGRNLFTQLDPMAFAILFQSDALENDQDPAEITFNDMHFMLYREAMLWKWSPAQLHRMMGPNMPKLKTFVVGPRGWGKTHMMGKILPFWAAAHNYIHLMALVSDTGEAAGEIVKWWEDEIKNKAIYQDHFDGLKIVQGEFALNLESGFAIRGAGAKARWRGLAAGNQRPDLVIMDDIDSREPGGIRERQKTIEATMNYLGSGIGVRQYLQGTNTSPGNITDQLLTQIFEAPEAAPPWTVLWRGIYCNALTERPDGTERSTWPGYVPAEGENGLLYQRAHNPKFRMEMENRSFIDDSDWFRPELFDYVADDELDNDLILMSVDPAVSTNPKNARTGIAIIGFNSKRRDAVILAVDAGHWGVLEMRRKIDQMADQWRPQMLVWETNQGGTTLAESILMPNGIKLNSLEATAILTVAQGMATRNVEAEFAASSKEARFQRFHGHFLRVPRTVRFRGRKIEGTSRMISEVQKLEQELLSYPEGLTKDLIDAAATGVWIVLDRPQQKQRRGISSGWSGMRRLG